MARANWLNDESTPDLDAHVSQLEHFAAALADGVVDSGELVKQEQNLVAAMRAVESTLSDDQHAKVTALLAELTAYNVMQVLHDMAAARVEQAMARKK
jgi:mannose/fructose-specific phosphotransferase system component IIA